MAQSSPQPQSVTTAIYAWANALPSSATSSSSSGELHLYIENDMSFPSVPVGPRSSSQELPPHENQLVPQPPLIFGTTTQTAIPKSQPPPQSTSISSWADEVAIAEQSRHSTPETVFPNLAYFGRCRGSRPRSQPLEYSPPVIPTSSTQRPQAPQSRYGSTILPLQPQPSFQQRFFCDRPTGNYPCTDPSPRRRPRATAHVIYPVQSSPIHASQSLARHTASPPKGPQPSSSCGKGNPFAPTKGIFHRAPGPNFRFHQFTNPLRIDTIHSMHVPERINYTSTPPQHTLKPTSSSCSPGQVEKEYFQEGRDRALPLECLHFPINHRFTERFRHQSKYFFALADRQNDYSNNFSLAMSPLPYLLEIRPLLSSILFFLYHIEMDVNNQTHKINGVKMLQTYHNYLFVQHLFHRTNQLIHMNSRLQYANIKLTSPYYLNHSYSIQPK